MRSFLDAILVFINCSTLSDDEWAGISSLNDLSYNLENYNALAGILQARESVSAAKDRLKFYFNAASLNIPLNTPSNTAKTDLFLGDAL